MQITAPQAETANVVAIKKADDEEQIVFGEVYYPGFPDSQGDFASAEEVKKMAYKFMKTMSMDNIDIQHNQEKSGSYIVESFIAREDDTIFIPGSWVVGVHIPSEETWGLVKSGEINGFSMDGYAVRTPTVVEYTLPDLLKGKTLENEGHTHFFIVKYDEEGNFLGGQTDAAEDGHSHVIKSGTVTETTNGHSHRYDFVEGILAGA